ncbi:MAG: carboxypeptidase regulatory-like domain-containing protein [Planctomycetes bacterium]|nr:carboxypeptidase regulatory-like domain-containing protein [Planctomycetota bacterium]
MSLDPNEHVDDAVLEANLARLFARAYVAVEPRPEFRAHLAQALSAGLAIASQATVDVGPRSGATRRRKLFYAAAAGLVFVLGVWFFALRAGPGGDLTPDVILARGSVALRAGELRTWSELAPERARRGLDLVRERLEVATPDAHALELRLGSAEGAPAGTITVGTASLMWVGHEEQGDCTRSALYRGSARLDRLTDGEFWLLSGADSLVLLNSGVLTARLAPAPDGVGGSECLYVRLERGAASIGDERETRALSVGVEVALRDGRALTASTTLAAPGARTGRTGAYVPSANEGGGDTATVETKADETARLVGTLVGATDSTVHGDYTVTLLRRERLPAISTPRVQRFAGADRFVIEALKPGTYDIFLEGAGFAVWRAAGIELAASETREITVTRQHGATLAGRVVSDATGDPIAGAVVIVEDEIPAQVIAFTANGKDWSAATQTGSDGTFRFEHVAPGAHTLRATAVGHGAVWTATSVTEALPTAEPLELRLPRPGSITGAVARDDGRPWSGAVIIASYLRAGADAAHFGYGMALADETGRYTIPDLPAGEFVLLNVTDARGGRDATGSRQVRVEAGAETVADIPDRADGAVLEGRVLAQDGSGLAGLAVTLQPSGVRGPSQWRSEMTDARGAFTFRGLPRGQYDVFVGHDLGGAFVQQGEISIPAGGKLVHDLHLADGLIRGSAVRRTDGSAVAGAFVLLEVQRGDTFVFAGRGSTDAAGRFSFDLLRPATYRASVFPSEPGLSPTVSHDLWIARPFTPLDCDLIVERGAVLVVRVRAANGTFVPNAAVTFVDDAGATRQMTAADTTDGSGTLVVPSIRAGRWQIGAQRGDERAQLTPIELQVGEERELVLELH